MRTSDKQYVDAPNLAIPISPVGVAKENYVELANRVS
jgi:hypothetical protein